MKMNKKAVNKILLLIGIIIILWLFYYFVFFLPAYEALTTRRYAHNKLALILACIEDYKMNHGYPPDHLSQVEEKANEYLLSNPDFSSKYLFAAWTNKKVPLFMMPALAKGGMIKLNELKYIRDGNDYYLYFWRTEEEERLLSKDELKEIISNCNYSCWKYVKLIIAYNGKIIFSGGMTSKDSKPITFINLKNYLKENVRHKTFVWYIFDK